MDERTSAIAEQIQGLYEELRQRVIQLRAELEDSEGAAEGLRLALQALGVEVEGGLSEISGDRLRDEMYRILREIDPDQHGVRVQEIAERVEAAGHVIRGRDKAGNARAHMSASPRFRSIGRGVWTWSDEATQTDVDEEASPGGSQSYSPEGGPEP